MTNKQTKTAIILGIIIAVTLVLYFAVLRPIINEVLPEIKEQLQLDDGEVAGVNDRVMLFEQVERASIQSIEVKNKHGKYRFVRRETVNEQTGQKSYTFDIEGHMGASYDQNLFSTLVVDTGFTLSKVKVVNDNPDKLSDYGLSPEQEPAYYILTTVEGVQHKVWVGDAIPSNGGYYVKYDTRNTVYVLDTTLETTVLAPIENFVTPTLVMPSSLTTYFMLNDLAIFKGTYLPEKTEDEEGGETEGEAGGEETGGEETGGEAEGGEKEEVELPSNVTKDPYVRFHYLTDEEKAKLDSNATFYMDYPGDGAYYASGAVDGLAQMLIAYQGIKTVKLGPTDEDLKNYGCFNAEYTLYVVNNQAIQDAKGVTHYIEIPNYVYFSEMKKDEETGEEFRYAYSVLFNIVARVPYYDCEFLRYDMNTWVNNSLFSMNINKVSYITVEGEDVYAKFTLKGQDADLIVETNTGHKPEVKNFRNFYKVILGLTKSGDVNLTDEQVAALVANDKNITATLTINLHSGRTLVYRFYSYGVQTYYTINGEGEFYLPTSQVNKLLADAVRVETDQVVNPDNAV